MIEFVETAVQYDRERVFRRLHIEPGTEVYAYSASVFPRLEELLAQKLHMYNCYQISQGQIRVDLPEVDGCAYQVACLSTCTREIADTIDGLLEQGEFLEGYVLNDLVNDVIFNASDQMNRQIDVRVRSMGCHLTRRWSPGEGELDLRYQEVLLARFREAADLGHITLNESYMLKPERSMLYLYGADPKLPWIPVEHDCRQCPNLNCQFRTE